MTKQFAKFGSVFAGVAMALSFASPVGAVTVAELQAQINALMAQLATLQGGSANTSYTFTQNLTVGSTGGDVTSLQQFLVGGAYLNMPAGVAYGYFGNLTKSAVAAWQAANGITPAVGYWGPISRAKANAMGGSVVTPGTPSTPGSTGITTPGAEGTLTVTAGTVSNATVYADDSMASILAFKAKAQNSDIALQRIKLDLGTDSKIYTRAYSKIYLVDEAGATIASSDLNSSTVVKDGTIYYITLTGFSSVVPKDATKTFTIKVDVRGFSSTDTSLQNASWTVRLAASGVRGIDGAGIDQYSPAAETTVSKAVTTTASQVDSATLTLSTNVNTPLTQEVIAALGTSNNEADKVALLTFDIKATKDTVLLTDVVATITKTAATASTATASSTYLYVGDTLIGSASVGTDKLATFSDIDYSIPKDTTKTFTLKADIRNADSVQSTFTAVVTGSTQLTAENSVGDTVTALSGTATSNSILVTNVGPVFSLVGTPTIVKTSTPVQNNYSTSTLSATFQLHIKAVGGSILLGTNASGTPMVSNVTVAGDKSFITYLGGAANSQVTASSTDFSFPSSGSVVTTGSNSVTLAQDAEITVPVTFTFQGNLATGVGVTNGSYSFGLERINWVGTAAGTLSSSTFMSGLTNWRTPSISLP